MLTCRFSVFSAHPTPPLRYKYPRVDDSQPDPLAVARIATGLALCVVGYRFNRVMMPLAALFVGGDYVASVMTAVQYHSISDVGMYWVKFAVAGAVIGALALHAKTGAVLCGAAGGIALVGFATDVFDFQSEVSLCLVLMGVAGAVCSVAAACSPKRSLVLATSLVGASLAMNGIGFFLLQHKATQAAKQVTGVASIAEWDPNSLLYLHVVDDLTSVWRTKRALLCGVCIGSAYLQFKLTGSDVHHRETHTDTRLDEENPVDETKTAFTIVLTPTTTSPRASCSHSSFCSLSAQS